MKTIKATSIFGFLFCILINCDLYAQCGPGVENIAITNYCNNQYASWTITNPGVGASYRWMTTIPSDLTNPSATPGNVIIGVSTTASSITRLAHPTGTATGQIQYYYIKETASNVVPTPIVSDYSQANTSNFRMNFTTSNIIRLNSIQALVKIYDPNTTYKLQAIISGPGFSIGSNKYTYKAADAVQISGQDYLITIPINVSLTSTGTFNMTLDPNPPGGETSAPAFIYSTTNASSVGPGISVNSGNYIGYGSYYSRFYNWNYTSYCGPNPSGNALPTTTGCCTPILFSPTIGSAENVIQTGLDAFTISSVNLSECTGTGCYYQWYRNGVAIPGAVGLNRTTYVATTSGLFTSRLVLNSSYLANNSIINNLSCYAEGNWNMDERAIFASATTTGTAPYCVGTVFALNSTVTGFNIQWTPSGSLTSPTTKSTSYVANAIGSVQFTVSANIMSNNKIINGDFETGVVGPAGSTQLNLQADPGGVDNSYAIRTSVPAQDNSSGTNSYWKSCTGDGRFFIGNAFNSSTNTRIYSQSVSGLTPGQTYTLTYDLTNISRNKAYNDVPPFGADTDARFLVFINAASVGGIVNTGAAGDVNKVCIWTTNTVNWTAPAGVSSADIEIRQVQLFNGLGLDFGLDNIRFGGLVTQNAKVTVGPVVDCSTIVAFASSCSSTNFTLTASVTGGMIFSRWEKPLGTILGTNAVLNVSSATGGVYTAFGLLPLNNVLSNGDFESGNTGFLNGNPTYFKYQANFGSGGDNAYTVTNNTQAGNGSWLTLTPPVSGTGTNIYVGDIKPPGGGKTGNKIVGWTFNAMAGQNFLFNGYVANLHKDVNQTAFTVYSANIGIEIGTSTVTSLALASTNSWNFISGLWTAPTTGSYTLNVADYSSAAAQAGFGNDIALDNFSLRPLFGTFKTATVTGPVCVLSIELQSFDISKKSNGVQLDWKTFSNKSKNGFYIERSNDGINFTTIGFIDSPSSTNNGSETFTFIDKKPLDGVNYYRLKQIDLNGKEDYSEVKSINLQEYAIQVYPNPNNGLFTISWGVKNTLAKILIYNALGTLVYETESEPYTSSKDINLQSLASGLYSAIISTNGATQTIKLVKE